MTTSKPTKAELLSNPVEHIDIAAFDARPVIDAYSKTAFQARNLASASDIMNRMLADTDCAVILTLAGSMISAGLKKAIVTMIERNMIDAIVATGANIVDQDFFEGLGFRHYMAPGSPEAPVVDDPTLRDLGIDRIYDTYIDEDQLRICDDTIGRIADALEPRPYSSREFIDEMGAYLAERHADIEGIVLSCHRKRVPIFVPAFSDCSAGFGLVMHQHKKTDRMLSIDSAADFRELTQIKLENPQTGLLMLGGGVPKNFAQDIVVCAELLGHDAPMHRYAIQLTVADSRDGALSGSTLREACSWGKVDVVDEQMVFGEATTTFPLLASDAYHRGSWKKRPERKLADLFAKAPTPA
ncbi:MAG: deoxyhypusine synthase [Phycisphaeraceae bacterium]|nr:MAG: deoxyhypusine synthase [Phycisphaeraceae bacterium]